jgi:tRNA/tmRNA/rRNA uracil-C5-methylase (TrmA/RlmC/RlmD family)
MRSNRVVPLPRECEVVGVETTKRFGGAPPPSAAKRRESAAEGGGAPLSVWEVDGRLITDGALTIEGYYVTTDAFFQINRHLLQTMLRLVSAHADRVERRDVAIDLYSGVGFFTVPLAGAFRQVIAVEGSRASHECAKRNVPANVTLMNTPIEAYEMPEADFIFLDPPRAGVRKEVVRAVGEKGREIVCYLSCDPVTFSRDASRLTASGWRLSTLDLLDLFPNTHHVETLASFERA